MCFTIIHKMFFLLLPSENSYMKICYLAILGVVLSLLFPVYSLPLGGVVKNGVADFSQTPLTEVVALDGEWLIAPYKFIEHQQAIDAKEIILVPGSWYDRRPDLFVSHQGYATYTLKLKFSAADVGLILALRIPQVATAYRLFLDDREMTSVGSLATTETNSVPEYRRQILPFIVTKKEIILRIQVSNYEEAYVGGLWKSLEIGPISQVQRAREIALFYDLILMGALLVFGIYHSSLFFLRREDKTTLSFGLFCFTVGLRTSLTGEQTLPSLGWLSFFWQLKLEYATIYCATGLFSWYVYNLFPREYNRVFLTTISTISSAFLLYTLAMPPIHFALLLPVFQIFILFTGVWLIFVAIRAIYRKRSGAKIFIGGLLLLIAAALNDILVNRSGQGSFQLPLGLLAFIFSQSYIMSLRYSSAFNAVKKLSNELQSLNNVFRKFVPADALKLLSKNDISSIVPGEQTLKELTVLFADIRNFTTISEKMTPAENFNFLNSYLQQVGPVIRRNGGFIDKYLGDGFMALFPASPDGALDAAVELQQELQKYNEGRKNAGYEPITVGIGLHYGPVMLGTIGESERMDVTVISDTVNLAARIQELSRQMETPILISELLFQRLISPHDLSYRMLGQVHLKGKTETAMIFEILSGRPEEQAEALALSKGVFERGIMHYLEKDYDRASELFEKALQVFPEDKVAKMYLERCRSLATTNQHEDWRLADSGLV